MLASLNRLPNIDHRTNFLTKHHNAKNNYMSHAAEILMHNGKEQIHIPSCESYLIYKTKYSKFTDILYINNFMTFHTSIGCGIHTVILFR